MNPFLALVYVLNMRSNPLVVKQMLADLEFSQKAMEICKRKLKDDNLKRHEEYNYYKVEKSPIEANDNEKKE